MPFVGQRLAFRWFARLALCTLAASLLSSCMLAGDRPAPAPVATPVPEYWPPAPPSSWIEIAPLYNVTIAQHEQDTPVPGHVVVPDRQANTARLSIGYPDPKSVIQAALPNAVFRNYSGELQVTFSCLVCADQRPQRRTLQLQEGISITDVEFPFVPSRRSTIDSKGVGSIVFTIYHFERAVDRISVPILTGAVDVAGIAAASDRPLQPEVTSLSEVVQSPLQACESQISADCTPSPTSNLDIRLSISQHNEMIAIAATPISQRITNHLRQAGWDATTGAEIEFQTALTSITLQQSLNRVYKRLQTAIKSPDDPALRAVARALTGDNTTVEHSLHLSDQERDAVSLLLAIAGNELYWNLQRTRPGKPEHRRFLDVLMAFALAQADTDTPLRMVVSNSTPYYIPWQLLYVRQFDDAARPRAEIEGFLGYLAEVSEDRVYIGSIRARDNHRSPILDGSETLYAMYSAGKRPEDTVTVRASNLLAHLQSVVRPPEQIAVSATRSSLFSHLRARSHDLRLLAFYAHGKADSDTGGPELRLNDADDYLIPAHLRWAAGNEQPFFAANPVVLIAACEMGTGGEEKVLDDDGFPAIFLALGAASVVAPVSEVWASYAEHFARDFISLHAAGRDAQTSVRQTVRKHVREFNNPAGLLFSTFGDSTT